MTHFIIALIAFTLGFVIGLRSKAQAKMNKRGTKQLKGMKVGDEFIEPHMSASYDNQLSGGNVHVKDRTKMPARRQAPPPPASRIIREGSAPEKPKSMEKKVEHVKPGIMYSSGTFANVHQCTSCKAIGHEYDMFRSNPCPKCGGSVKRHGAAKWMIDHWAMSKA